MRLTTQIIRSRAKRPLQHVEYLDLSGLEIVKPEKLSCCSKLQSLVLSGNQIDVVANLEHCPQLWSIDLSNNQINNLEGLNRFVALGNLVLSNNNLTWQELAKIRHIHILNLSLHGNEKLQKDPYYRIHVVDCLPNVWMLDGRFISSAERIQVEHFFTESAFTDHPVRHKLKEKVFTPSNLKKIEVTGVFGERATHMMTKFPTNGAFNIETDNRRMKYLAYNLEEDLKLINKCLNLNLKLMKHSPQFLETLMENRDNERERCNMLLLLLTASLEFALPAQLVKATLEIAKLDKVSNASTIELFLLPKRWRCMVACILLGAVKVDRDKEIKGGLYGRLYLCLYYIISELAKLCYADDQTRENYQPSNPMYKDYRSLLASEIVQLLCIVPSFYQYLTQDAGVVGLVRTASDDLEISDKVSILMESIKLEGSSTKVMYATIADFVLKKVQNHAETLFHKTKQPPVTQKMDTLELHPRSALPRRPQSSPIHRAQYHAMGQKSPDKRAPRVVNIKPVKVRPPCLGDRVLLGPQNEAKIISIPEHGVALAQVDIVPVQGMMPTYKTNDTFIYIDLKTIEWDSTSCLWRPKGSVGDRITFDHTKSPKKPNPLSTAVSPREPMEEPVKEPEQASTKIQHDTDIPTRPMSSLLCDKLDIKLGVTQGTVAENDKVKNNNNAENVKIDLEDTLESWDSMKSPLYDSINAAVRSFTGNPPKSSPTLRVTPSTGVVGPVATRSTKAAGVPVIKCDQQQEKETINNNNTNNNNNIAIVHDNQDSLHSGDEPELDDLYSNVSEPVSGGATFHSASRPDTAQTHYIPIPTDDGGKDSFLTGRERMSPVTIRVPDQSKKEEFVSTEESPLNKSGYEVQYAPYRRVASTPRSRTVQSALSHRPGYVAKAARPISAVGAYKFIISKGSNQNTPREEDVTTYQKLRTEAWKRSSVEQNSPPPTPPPQRPSSPEYNDPSFTLQFRNANRWLAGGRDLYWEEVGKRPKSGHTPGWKEGVENTAPNRVFRRSRPPEIITPSSMFFEEFAAAGIDRRSFQRMLNVTAPDLEVPSQIYQPPAQFGIRSWYLTSQENARPDTGQTRRPYVPNKPPEILCHVCSAKEGDCLHDYEYQLELMRAEHQRALGFDT